MPFEVRKDFFYLVIVLFSFLNERFISLETLHGVVSGFVSTDEVFDLKGDKGFIRGLIEDVKEDSIILRINGSFFTTTGLTALSMEWAKRNLGSD